MSTVYKYKKCNLFGFSKKIDTVKNKFENVIIYDNDNIFVPFENNFIEKCNKNDTNNIVTFVFDLESDFFKDINILIEDNKKASINNNNYKREEGDINKIISGQSTQLNAFTKNIYTVIYGKKTANIDSGHNNSHIFNHNVIDSLAKNGIISDQVSSTPLSVHVIMDSLEKLHKFNVFFVHSKCDLEYCEHESPNEISNPVYIKSLGEITAVFYRNLILRFFPYLTIVSESMRENAYLF